MGRATVQNGRSFAYALENPMDIMTGVGLVCGIIVVSVMILMGGDLHMFISEHAALIVIGGVTPAPLLPLSLLPPFFCASLRGGVCFMVMMPLGPAACAG